MKKNPLSRFVVVGTINDVLEVTRYTESESRTATAAYRAKLEKEDQKKEITFSSNNEEMKRKAEEGMRMIFPDFSE